MRAMRALYHNNKNVPVKTITSIKTFDLSVFKCGTAQKIKSYKKFRKKVMHKNRIVWKTVLCIAAREIIYGTESVNIENKAQNIFLVNNKVIMPISDASNRGSFWLNGLIFWIVWCLLCVLDGRQSTNSSIIIIANTGKYAQATKSPFHSINISSHFFFVSSYQIKRGSILP